MRGSRVLACSFAALVVLGCEEGSGQTAAGGDTTTDGGDGGDAADETSGSAGGADASGGATAGGDGGGDGGLDEVEAACEADCEAQFATECAPANHNVLTCKLTCAATTVQLGDFCLSEYTSLVQCRADGGYDCVNGYPYPRSTCAAEQAVFAECTADLGCKRYCDDAIEAGCGGASFDACLDACVAEKAETPQFCAYYLDALRLCEAQGGIECVDGQPRTAGDCTYQVANVGDCLSDETGDACLGYCFVADAIACGTDCAADCASRLADPTCGQAFASLVDCELRHGDFECLDGRLVGVDICDYDDTNYRTCLEG